MVVNAIIEVGRKHAAPLVPTRHVAKKADTRPRARVINISNEEMRHHEAVMEARHAAQSARNDLQSAANALAAANAENDRLSRRVKELESENARIRNELDSSIQECLVLSKALDGLKSGDCEAAHVPAPLSEPCHDLVAEAGNAMPATTVSAKQQKKRHRNKKNKAETLAPAPEGVVQQ